MAEHHLDDGRIRRDIGTPDVLLAADPLTVINPEGTRNYGSLDGIYAKTAAAYVLHSYGSTLAEDLWPWGPEYALPRTPLALGDVIQHLEWAKQMCDAEIERILLAFGPSAQPPADAPLVDRHAYEREMLARHQLAERRNTGDG